VKSDGPRDANANANANESMTHAAIEALLTSMEELQKKKVLELARRLKPGLTLEDLRNPHDFPELADTDWHYEDGVMTGIQSVLSALRAEWRKP
jgi:hypothetical protein